MLKPNQSKNLTEKFIAYLLPKFYIFTFIYSTVMHEKEEKQKAFLILASTTDI